MISKIQFPDSRSQVAAHQYNVDLSSQRARQVHESDFAGFKKSPSG
jgi:protein-tyrosine-phosphatase